ncbi:GNAT family N-acetyltransferase [Clostridium sp.]|uniref:GNAT family N-acetyltransferase n=1 Tax=Clostridium sp. TaxID=1506 RepID=UPI001A3A0A05|nr:GNAT family N-acetyltransferase [Clostridium sp.]MBK5235065.1 GNAT family N-acetyltransferase [Clostridium sp.]
MTIIRQAKKWESKTLTNIAIKSEAYWGYDSDYMENFKSLYKVTEEFISNNITYIIEENDSIIGFYGILRDDKEISLEYLYVEPKSIGKGYGKLLWNHMVETCKNMHTNQVVLVTSPQAKEFYLKMGAIEAGEVDSIVIKNRRIPRLVYTL